MVAINAVNAVGAVGRVVRHRKGRMGISVERMRGIGKQNFTKKIWT